MNTVYSEKFLMGLTLSSVLLLAGCATTGAVNNATREQRIEQLVMGRGIGRPDQIKAYISQTAMHDIIVTDRELHFSMGNRFSLPLDGIVEIEVVGDAFGYDSNFFNQMGLNPLTTGRPLRAAKYTGLRLTFDQPVVNNFYSLSSTAVAFDVPTYYALSEGHVTESLESARPFTDPAPAQALKRLILELKSAQGSLSASGKNTAPDVEGQLRKLKQLLDQGLIDQATYDRRSAELLRQI